MALEQVPAEIPRWATDVSADVDTPSSGKQDAGWIVEEPPHQWFNWLHKWTYRWLVYLKSRVDALELEYDAVVTDVEGKGTDDTLQNAIDRVGAGSKILVVQDQEVDTTIDVDKDDLEIVLKPGVSILKGSATTGLNITGERVRLKGGKITGFNVGGDKAVVIDAAAVRAKLFDIDFSDNDEDYDDQAGDASVIGCHFS